MSSRPPIYSTLTEDPDFVELVNEFISNIPKRLMLIQQSLETQNIGQLRTCVHQLRGACGSYGFAEITPLATELEHLLHKSTSPDDWLTNLAQFVDACRRMTADPKPSELSSDAVGSAANCNPASACCSL